MNEKHWGYNRGFPLFSLIHTNSIQICIIVSLQSCDLFCFYNLVILILSCAMPTIPSWKSCEIVQDCANTFSLIQFVQRRKRVHILHWYWVHVSNAWTDTDTVWYIWICLGEPFPVHPYHKRRPSGAAYVIRHRHVYLRTNCETISKKS
jgi:hypothetical protein